MMFLEMALKNVRHHAPLLTRRQLLAAGAALAVAPLVGAGKAGTAQIYRLKAFPSRHRIVPSPAQETAVWSYGGGVPGPVIRARQGTPLRIDFENGLEEATTVHWHGLRIPNAMDGVPYLTQPPVAPGEHFVYEFEPPDAGLFWYHPHLRSSEQLARGLYGALVVEEPAPIEVDRDLIWVLDDWRLQDDGAIVDNFDRKRDISNEGRLGNTVTVNGQRLEDFTVRSGERLRLRLCNAANARVFALRFDDLTPTVVAYDGQPVEPHVPEDKRVILGSGMRAELVLDMSGDPGARSIVVDDYDEAYTFVRFMYSNEKPLRESPLDAPVRLAPNPIPEPDLARVETQQVLIEGGSRGNLEQAIYEGQTYAARKLWRTHRKIWTINGVASHGMVMDPMFNLKRGVSYKWVIKNDTEWDHPLHLHGHSFRILARDGDPVPHTPWADTVFLTPNETVEVAFVADIPGDWLFHCHILEHHKGGMGAVVRVV
jgi:FtsP/CotA-like multicopper oxidase with cupredoxin domain